jgi:hypothetical protein
MTRTPKVQAGVAAALVLSMIACVPAATPGATQDPYGLVRASIEQAAIVQSTTITKGDSLDPPVVDVYLRPGANVAQARDLVCTVVRPAVQSAALSDEERRDLGVDVWASDGNRTLATESDC